MTKGEQVKILEKALSKIYGRYLMEHEMHPCFLIAKSALIDAELLIVEDK